MKHMRILYTVLLALLCMGSMQAQTVEDGEAFYIYRNDGDFDGFFFDQVQEMRYSKIGLDSIEHDNYVVQEVVTADSIYRIPLAAIDSIGFVQPEIRFAPNVRQLDILDLTKYITKVKDWDLWFSKELPMELVPKVGEILIAATGPFAENGFGAKVRDVIYYSDSYKVICEKITEQTPIFDQYISVEEVTSNPVTGQVRRRVAGYDQIRRAGGYASGTLIDFSLNGHFSVIPDNAGVYFGVDVNSGLKVKLLSMNQIQGTHYFFKVMLAEEYSVAAGMSFAIRGSGSKTLADVTGMRPNILFPAAAPIFSIHPVPDLALAWSGEFKTAVTFPGKSGSLRQTFIIDSDSPEPIRYQGNESVVDDQPTNIFKDSSGDLQFNGSLGVGIKSEIGIFTASWLEEIFDLGISTDVFVGPKLEGQVNINLNGLNSSDGPYLLKDSHFTFSPLVADYNTYGKVNFILGGEPWKYTFLEGSFKLLPALDMYLLPKLDLKTVEYNKDVERIDASMETDMRMVFWPSEIGFCLLDQTKQNMLSSAYGTSLGFGDFAPPSIQSSFSTKGLPVGTYYVAPILNMFGRERPVRSLAKQVDIPPYLEFSQDSINAEKGDKEYIIPFKTTFTNVEAFNIYNWMKVEILEFDPELHTGKLKVTVEKNGELYDRAGGAYIEGTYDKGPFYRQQFVVPVRQKYGAVVTKVRVGAGFYSEGEVNSDATSITLFPAIDVTPSREGDIITISASKFFPDTDYATGYAQTGTNASFTYTSEVSFSLVVDLKNDKIASGSVTFAGNGNYDYYKHHDPPYYDKISRYNGTTNASATFENVPGRGRQCLSDGSTFIEYYGGTFTSASGSKHLHWYYQDPYDGKVTTTDENVTIKEGATVSVYLFYEYQE